MSKNKLFYLDQLKPGQKCKLIDVDISGATGQRLIDMGFIPGVEIEVLRNAQLEIRGYNVSIRHSDAKYIEVNVL